MVVGGRVRGHEFLVERPGRLDGGFVPSLGAKRRLLQLLLLLQTLVRPHLPATLKHTLILNVLHHCFGKTGKIN